MEKGSLSEMLRCLACFCAGPWAGVSPLCCSGTRCSSCRCAGGSFTVCFLCVSCVHCVLSLSCCHYFETKHCQPGIASIQQMWASAAGFCCPGVGGPQQLLCGHQVGAEHPFAPLLPRLLSPPETTTASPLSHP